MRSPSIKTLTELTDRYTSGKRPDDPRAAAALLKKILDAETHDELAELIEKHALTSTADYWRSCYFQPGRRDLKLKMADEILGTHGVEHIAHGRGSKSPAVDYCNTGDTYNPTLVYIHWKGFRVTDWGTIVERGSYE